MRSHPRLRRVVKWGGPALAVMLAIVWVWAGFRYMYIETSCGADVSVSSGRLGIRYIRVNPGDMLSNTITFGAHKDGFELWFDRFIQPGAWMISIPLWFPAVLFIVIGGVGWFAESRARRRALLKPCNECGYSRVGLAGDAPCPECGRAETRGASSTP